MTATTDARVSGTGPRLRWPFWVAAFCVLLAIASLPFDGEIWDALRKWKNATWINVAGAMGRYTEWQWLMLPAAIGFTVAWKKGNVHWKHAMLAVMLAGTLSGIAAATLRGATGRVRPRAEYKRVEPGWYGPVYKGKIVAGNWDFNSFPSGHSTVAMACVGALLATRWRLGICLLPFPILVGAARMYNGSHHLSDVFAGFALGLVFVGWVVRRLDRTPLGPAGAIPTSVASPLDERAV